MTPHQSYGTKVKAAILIWVAVYLLVTTISVVMEPLVSHLALPLRTFVLSAIMVPIMIFLIMPGVRKLLSRP